AAARDDLDSLRRAMALYRGPLLEGCAEPWVLSDREAREQAYLRALEALAHAARADGELETAVRYLRLAAAVDPLRQTAHRSLMEGCARSGDRQAAVEVYHAFRRRLHREANATPDPETTALFRRIREGEWGVGSRVPSGRCGMGDGEGNGGNEEMEAMGSG